MGGLPKLLKVVAADLKAIYASFAVEEAHIQLREFDVK
jgi:hypothetical protein